MISGNDSTLSLRRVYTYARTKIRTRRIRTEEIYAKSSTTEGNEAPIKSAAET